MFEKIFGKLAELQEKYPFVFIILIIALAGVGLLYAVDIETDPSFDTVIPLDSNYNSLKNKVINEFGVTDTMFILVEVDQTSTHPQAVKDVRDPRGSDRAFREFRRGGRRAADPSDELIPSSAELS